MKTQDRERTPGSRRLRREASTVETMVRMYCREFHGSGTALCSDCDALLEYARDRLYHCPFQHSKPTCAKCTVHCYRPDLRRDIKTVMRWAGPRMLGRHPLMALMHLVDGLRKEPAVRRRRSRGTRT